MMAVILLTVPIALLNGTLEEVLWRGAYVRAFPSSLIPGYLHPALGFGLWYLVPLCVGLGSYTLLKITAFIGGGVLFGLCRGWVAWRTGLIC